MYMEEYIW